MQYTTTYTSPLGEILLAADESGLTGLWFQGQKYFAQRLSKAHKERMLPVLEETKQWLSLYFAGQKPSALPPLHLMGTDFQREVWQILCTIPYGETMTYGEIAQRLAERRGIAHMSAQAVGSAVAHNGISILVPCHRVVGAGGNLTGYAGGIHKKIELLKLEGAWSDAFYPPRHSTAP